jgi:protein-tyrosine phosphatase
MKKVLFVCLGNICRSPLAEGIAKNIALEMNLDKGVFFDSCGTSNYHIGGQPDSRTVGNAKKNGLILNHKARQFEIIDFERFDYILTMDSSNKKNIIKLDKNDVFRNKISLMREFDPEQTHIDVPDPYFGGDQGFQNVYDILNRSVRNFIEKELA